MPEPTNPTETFEASLEFHWPDSTKSIFANQITVQVTDGVCFLGFYEAVAPVVLGTPEEVRAKMSDIKTIRANGVARIVFPLSKAGEIILALERGMSLFANIKPKEES